MILNIVNHNFAIAASHGETDEMKKNKIHKMINDFPVKLKNAPTMNAKAVVEVSKDTQVIYVDVRKDKEMKVSMILNAVSQDDFEKNMSKYKNMTIIPYCTIGYRSAKYTLELTKKGYKSYNLEGGVLLWAFAGFKLYDPSHVVTYDVHVYGKDWNLLPRQFRGVW